MLLAATFSLQQSGASGVLKHLSNALIGLGRAFEVLVGANLLPYFLTLFCGEALVSYQFTIKYIGPRPSHLGLAPAAAGSNDSLKSRQKWRDSALTSSGVTGFWLVFRSSSMVLLS